MLLTAALPLSLLLPAAARAQQCETHQDERALGHLDGLRIDSVDVVVAAPALPSGIAGVASRLHARTDPSTVRRIFDQSSGTPIDTLRLAESLRTLRRTRILSDVALDTRECRTSGSVRLTLRTTDAWTARARVRIARSSLAASLGEDNLLGRAHSLRTSLRIDEGQPGFGVRYVDPWFAGTPLSLAVGRTQYKGGYENSAQLQSTSPRLDDRWRLDLGWTSTSRQSLRAAGDRVGRLEWRGIIARQLWRSSSAALALQLGGERTSARIESSPGTLLVGPSQVTRDVSGALVGLSRTSVTFMQRPLFAGSGELVELPSALEGDATVTIGRDAATGRATRHVDAWMGKLWSIGASGLLSANGWWSGYKAASEWSAGDTRASLLALLPVRNGEWSARVATEALRDPDPDTRALVSFDPTARLLPSRGLAEAAALVTVERSWRGRRLSRGYDLGGALFASASRRWDLASYSALASRDVAIAGVGLRLLPTRVARATLRLDLAVPVGAPAGVSRRPFLAFSISPWLEQERHRDGRTTP